MKKYLPALITSLISSAFYSSPGVAESLKQQCHAGVPHYQRPLVQGNNNDLPITIHADHVQGSYPHQASFTGNVDISQGNSHLHADTIHLQQKTFPGQSRTEHTVDADGNISYDDHQIILRGPKAWANLTSKDANIWHGSYQMVGRQGRGHADVLKQRDNNRYTILENGSFTTCLPGSNTWSVAGSEVIHDRQEQLAEIWNARFMLGSVPIFYSPYLQLPVGDKRRSGFLIPLVKYSNTNSLELVLPYYWSIAPNFDATITPHYIQRRGSIQWQTEFRYLTRIGAGITAFDYLSSDSKYQPINNDYNNRHRWLVYWNHNGMLDNTWRLQADFTKVSDPRYFNDFSSQYGSSTDGYATQKFSLGYFVRNFDSTLSSTQFQLFGNTRNASSWRTQPQLDMNLYANNIGPFDARIYAQAVRFVNINNNFPKATRIHLEPVIDLPLSNRWGSINTEVKFMATYYQQDNINRYRAYTNNDSITVALKNHVNRLLPQFKIDGKVVFERETHWLAGYTQTLEPRIQYLYLPYRDQSSINNYDSSLLQFDYSGLFRDRSYGGLDRIASANQLTTGITSRFYNTDSEERFNFSLGQIYYFNESRVGDDKIVVERSSKRGSLLWAGDLWWRLSDYWGVRGGAQYDSRLNKISTGSGVVEYRQDDDRLLQFSYRYASSQYVQSTLPDYARARQYKDGISQAGVVASWPIKDNWSVVGAYYYDVNANQAADQMLGVQYSSCCYAIRLGFERKINGWERDQSKYDNVYGIKIELRGLSSDYGLGTQQMLSSNILPYQKAF